MSQEEALRQAEEFLIKSGVEIKRAVVNVDLSGMAPNKFKNSFPIEKKDVVKAIKEIGENGKIDTPAKAFVSTIIIPGYKERLAYWGATKVMAEHSEELGGIFKDDMKIYQDQYAEIYSKLLDYQKVLKREPVNPQKEQEARSQLYDECATVVSGCMVDNAGTKFTKIVGKIAVDEASKAADRVKEKAPEAFEKAKGLFEKGKGFLKSFDSSQNTATPEEALKESGAYVPSNNGKIAGVAPDKVQDHAALLAAQQIKNQIG